MPDPGGIGLQQPFQPGLGQAQKAQHQRQACPALVTAKGVKDLPGLAGVEGAREDRAHNHIGRDQGHCFLGIEAELGSLALTGLACVRTWALPRSLGCRLGLKPFHHGLHRPFHQGKHPSQLGDLQGLIDQAPLALPFGPIYRKESLANQGLQEPLGVGMFREGLWFFYEHLAHQVRLVDQDQLQPETTGAANADAEIPLIQQAKPGAQAPAQALEQIGGEGLGLGPDRLAGLWPRLG